jgi:hypothetical protein
LKIAISFEKEHYYRTCSNAYRWDGVLKNAPDWLIEFIEAGEAVVFRGDKALQFIDTKSGYPRAEVGDIIVLTENNYIDVIRKAQRYV